MILSRISKAVREQNWFAVTIEFVIVIAGVVIGFQITEWRGEQSDRETERVYLTRLHHDMVRSTCALQRDALMVTGWNQEARRTLDAMLANDPDAVDPDSDGFELVASTRVTTGTVFPATLNELVNGQNMNLIRNDALRADIAEADAAFKARAELIRVLVSAQNSFLRDVQNRLRPTEGEVYDITYDFEALANDETFINALGHALRISHINIVWLDAMAATADSLRIAVAAEIGESTAPLDCRSPGGAS